MNCPCGSEKDFKNCCEKFISGEALPTTAEELMRSRYSAFATKHIDYLKNSLDPQNLHDFNLAATKHWADAAQFTGLEILRTEEKGNKGVVEFKAHYKMEGEDHVHHEIGTFRKQQGQWFYKSGKVFEMHAKAP